MLKTELLEIIANGENSGVEFKRDDIRPEQLAKEIVALVNFQGGRILLGVEDNGAISGLQRPDMEEWVMNVFADKVHPLVLPCYEEVNMGEAGRVAVLTFPQGNSKPYVRRHKGAEEIFIRVGSTSRAATREQQMRLYEIGGMLHTEALPVSRTSSADLDWVRIENYFMDIIRDPVLQDSPETWGRRWAMAGRAMAGRDEVVNLEVVEHHLANLGFLVEPGGMCTVAGMVLFGKQPRRHLKQAGLRVFAFSGKTKEYQARLDLIMDAPLVARFDVRDGGRHAIDDGLTEKFLRAIEPFIVEEPDQITSGLRRDKSRLYPIEAIREIVINALVHRDWTRSIDIEVGLYEDRLEVISPGGLHNSMTVEKMIAGLRYSRNTVLMETMRDYGYVDYRGMGIRNKVLPLLKAHKHPEPAFEANEDHLKTTLYRKRTP